MSAIEVAKFKTYLQEHLVTRFSMSSTDAKRAVRGSVIITLLQEDPTMVMHDSIESWSEAVYYEKCF